MSFHRLICFFSISSSFIGGGRHLKMAGLSPITLPFPPSFLSHTLENQFWSLFLLVFRI